MQAAWPTTNEVNTYLAGLGITAPAGLTVATVLAAAIQEWEQAVGVTPWLAPAATTLTLSPKGEHSIHIPPCADVDSVTLSDVLLVADTAYFLRPDLALANNRPITYIEFRDRVTGDSDSLEIVGRWGYQTTIFEEVWQLVLDLTVSKVLEAAQMKAVLAQSVAAAGAVVEVKQENVTVKYDSTAGRSFTAAVKTRMQELADKYRIRGF